MAAFNSAYQQYNGDEQKAFSIAWAAVNKQRGEAMHSDFQRIMGLFTKRFGAETGIARFEEFLANNQLTPYQAYRPETQFKESFEWIQPLIVPYKQDNEAKYYLVRALTANVSMNNKDYGPIERLEKAAPTLSWRPVNLDHDHTKWFSYPRTRVDYATESDVSVEATLRVDNRDAALQKMLDEGKIKHPSIEGRPDPEGGYHFTGMALLTIGESLPGDPLTEIIPLAFNESVNKKIIEATSYGGYEPPESGDLPNKGKEILAKVYADCRSNNPDRSKEACSKIAWGAVHNAGYIKNNDGKWVKESESEVKKQLAEEQVLSNLNIELESLRKDEKIKELEEQLLLEQTRMQQLGERVELERKNMKEQLQNEKTVFDTKIQTEKTSSESALKAETTKHMETQRKLEETTQKLNEEKLSKEKLRLELEQAKGLEPQISLLQNSLGKQRLEFTEKLEKLTQTKYQQEGAISQNKLLIEKLEAKINASNTEYLEMEKSRLAVQRRLEEMTHSRDEEKDLHEKLRLQFEKLNTDHQASLKENMTLINDLTLSKQELLNEKKNKINIETEMNTMREKIGKAQKFQKWAFNELKKVGVEVVPA
jgi:cation transport regulator ChaB